MNPWRPIIVVMANFAIGAAVTQGLVDPAQQNELAELIAEIVGYIIILATSIFSLVHAFRRPNSMKSQPSAIEQTVKTEVQTKPIFTPEPPATLGTPLSPNE